MIEGRAPLTLVVDNNVAVKWYIPQDFREQALRVFYAGRDEEALLMAPALIYAEFGNALWRYHQAGELSLAEIREIWDDFEQTPLSFSAIDLFIPRALEIATSCGCTVYDALYVALAVEGGEEGQEGAVAFTADRRLLRKLKGTHYEEFGMHIEDIGDFLPVS